jgi:hypothetical protein
MYLVALGSGREVLYRSNEELATAIAGGEVNSESRIYHRTTSTWVSITVHPAYRKLVGTAPDPAASAEFPTPPSAPMPMPRKQWTFLQADPGVTSAETAQPASNGGESQEPDSDGSAVSATGRRRFRFWR